MPINWPRKNNVFVLYYCSNNSKVGKTFNLSSQSYCTCVNCTALCVQLVMLHSPLTMCQLAAQCNGG